jgi:hypothetical protein
MAARQAECCLGVDAEEVRGFDGREKRFPDTLDLFGVIVCLLHKLLHIL